MAATDPQRFGCVSRAEYNRQQLAGLQTRSQQLRRAVLWLRLERMLLTGGPCTGRWRVFVMCWLILVGLGVAVAREVVVTLGLALGMVGMRLLFSWRVGVLVRRCDHAARPWSWRDGPRRCLQEAQRAWPGAAAAALSDLARQLGGVEGEMAVLAPADNPALSPIATWVSPLRLGVAAGMILCVLGTFRLVVSSGQAFKVQIASLADGRSGEDASGTMRPPAPANQGPSAAARLAASGLLPAMQEKVARGEYELVDEGFGQALHGPLTKWNLAPPAFPAPLPVASRVPATTSQRAYALVSAELLLQPYPRKGVNVLLVVRVPVQDRVGVMMYNARDRLLVDNDTLVMHGQLQANTWYKFENRNVIYLGTPSAITQENSLALR